MGKANDQVIHVVEKLQEYFHAAAFLRGRLAPPAQPRHLPQQRQALGLPPFDGVVSGRNILGRPGGPGDPLQRAERMFHVNEFLGTVGQVFHRREAPAA